LTGPRRKDSSARDRAIRFLEARDRSCKEVKERLLRAGEVEEDVQDAVEWLEELGYLDDRRFAATLAGEKVRAGWGPHRIRAELLRKGVARSIVGEIVGEGYQAEVFVNVAGGEEGVEDRLVNLVQRRYRRDLERDPEKGRNKVAGFLARRGHDWDLVNSVLRRVAGENGPGSENSA